MSAPGKELCSVTVFLIGLTTWAKRFAVTLAACLLRLVTLRNPFRPLLNWINESKTRGMHGWYDLVDWVGGWPFEVAKPEEIFRYLRDRGFILQELTTSAGHGCNEFHSCVLRSRRAMNETHSWHCTRWNPDAQVLMRRISFLPPVCARNGSRCA